MRMDINVREGNWISSYPTPWLLILFPLNLLFRLTSIIFSVGAFVYFCCCPIFFENTYELFNSLVYANLWFLLSFLLPTIFLQFGINRVRAGKKSNVHIW